MKKILSIVLVAAFAAPLVRAQSESAEYPDVATYLFAELDTCRLYMDVYEPAEGSETYYEGVSKPTILWLFGGGFVTGERSSPQYLPWFRLLNDNGYRVITVDYRPALRGKKIGFGPGSIVSTAKATVEACSEVGCRDLFTAVNYIITNKDALGVDPDNMVLAGSSAGAMISVTAEWEICNGMPNASMLPAGFNFKGVMSFSGAIMSDRGKPSWDRKPCQQLFFHGTDDTIVNYNKTQFFKLGIFGSSQLVERLKKQGYPYCIVRFEGHKHDIASSMLELWPWEKRWLEVNVMGGRERISDEWTEDPGIPVRSAPGENLDGLYGK